MIRTCKEPQLSQQAYVLNHKGCQCTGNAIASRDNDEVRHPQLIPLCGKPVPEN